MKGWFARRAGMAMGTTLLVVAGLPTAVPAQDREAGRALFETKCAACHSPGSERLVGPGLLGVTERRERDWLIAFITVPDRLIAGGDSIAEELLAEYGVPMPNLAISEEEARDILAFLARSSAAEVEQEGQPATTGEAAPGTSDAAAGDPALGRRLFTGERRLANGGGACISCHSVAGVGVLGGGTLARELTGAAGRYGPGLPQVIESSPFPLMQAAYGERPLTRDEIAHLTAFLEGAAESERSTASSPLPFAAFGLGGMLLLLGLAAAVWRGRLREVRMPLIGGRG